MRTNLLIAGLLLLLNVSGAQAQSLAEQIIECGRQPLCSKIIGEDYQTQQALAAAQKEVSGIGQQWGEYVAREQPVPRGF